MLNLTEDQMIDQNSCDVQHGHTAGWSVSLTSPEGRTGIALRKCDECLLDLMRTDAVQKMGRVANVRAITPRGPAGQPWTGWGRTC